MRQKSAKIPKYILVYYIYECAYILFWLFIPKLSWFHLEKAIFVYYASTIVAIGWIGYMVYRYFARKDNNVNIIVSIGLILLIQTVSNLI